QRALHSARANKNKPPKPPARAEPNISDRATRPAALQQGCTGRHDGGESLFADSRRCRLKLGAQMTIYRRTTQCRPIPSLTKEGSGWHSWGQQPSASVVTATTNLLQGP